MSLSFQLPRTGKCNGAHTTRVSLRGQGFRACAALKVQATASPDSTHAPASTAVVSRRQWHAATAAALLTAWTGLPDGASAASAPKLVFVAGSTGATGQQVVKALRAQGISVVAGVRDLKKAEAAGFNKDSGIRVVRCDVTQSPSVIAQAIAGVDAVVCATGGGAVTPFDSRAKKVDNQGTKNLVDAAKAAGVQSFVLVSSLLTNAAATGQTKNPNYVVLQLFGGVLEEKLQAEKYLRASGLRWTIIRPGGLSNEPSAKIGGLVVGAEDTFFGLETDPGREVSRQTVAEVCTQALLQDKAANKVFEILESPAASSNETAKWFDI